MKSISKFLIVALMIIVSISMISAKNLTSYGVSNGHGSSTNLRPINWIETDSGFSTGIGVGQISVATSDSNDLWAFAIDDTGGILDQFTRSTNGGQTWTPGTFNIGTGLSQLFAMSNVGGGTSDLDICWAVFNTGASQGCYKTQNGGVSWANMDVGFGASSFANVIHFFNDINGFAQGDPVDGYYELYTTSDGGDSWDRVPQGNIPPPLTGEYGITGNYYAVGNNIWWGTNKGRIFYSTDRGYSWSVTMTPFGTAEAVSCVFSDEFNGFAFKSYLNMGIEPEICITNNGGESYTTVAVSGDMYARWFSHVPGTLGTFVGSSSEPGFEGASFSEDGGHTWITLNSGVPVQASAFLDIETGWAGTFASTTGGMYIFDGILSLITGEISGTVTDIDEGFAIEGAVITLGTFSTTTDENGEYDMTLETGTYTLNCEIEGYEIYTQNDVEIIEDQLTITDFQMQNLYLPPLNLTYSFISPNVILEWEVPSASVGFTGYKLYRNGEMLTEISDISANLYIDQDVPSGLYIYYLTAAYGTHESISTNEVEVEVVEAGVVLPVDKTALNGNIPNPFNPTTAISFSLETAGHVVLEIFNVKGEKIRTLVDGNFQVASHSVIWNGKDDIGRTAASGIYFYKMRSGSFTSTKKMILMK